MVSLGAEVRQATRSLAKTPGFAAAVLLTLVVAVAANTVIFSVVNAILLRPLPYPEADRLVSFDATFGKISVTALSSGGFLALRDGARQFDLVSAFDVAGPGVNLSSGDTPEQVHAIHVSSDYFRLFGATTVAGRTFTAEEDRPGSPAVVVLGHGLWRRRFGADPRIVGSRIELNSEPYLVVGVLGAVYLPDPQADLWLPLRADPASKISAHFLRVCARLRGNATVGSADAEAVAIFKHFQHAQPDLMTDQESVRVRELRDEETGSARGPLLVLLGAVGFVLLIACVNVANLMLTRTVARAKEIAVRSALGATRGRIVRLTMIESLILGLAGGIVGLAVGRAAIKATEALYSDKLPRASEFISGIPMDWQVAMFTLAVSLGTGLLFGFGPAIQAMRVNVNSVLKETASRSSTGLHQNRARSMLIAGEMAMAVLLLSGATLLIRSFAALQNAATGIDARNILTMETSLVGSRYDTTDKVTRLRREVETRASALPGVRAVALSITIPIASPGIDLPFDIEGRAPSGSLPCDGDEQFRFVSPQYFKAFGIPVLQGRVFSEADAQTAEQVIVINEAMARKYWPSRGALGSSLVLGRMMGPIFVNPPRRIVGIVGNVRERGVRRGVLPIMYIPAGQVPDGLMAFTNSVMPLHWSIRVDGDPLALAPAVRNAFLAADRGLPVAKVETMQDVMASASSDDRFNTALLGSFAFIALILAAIGTYGVISYGVEQRRQELGIRAALGQTPWHAWRLVAGGGMRSAVAGLIGGTLGALGLSRLLRGMLYGVTEHDPLTYLLMSAILIATALAACSVPAWRATRSDPMTALRHE